MKFLKMEEIRRWISCWRRVQSFFFFVGGATNVNVEISWSQVWPNLQEDRVYSQTTRWGRLPRDMTYEADGLKSVLGLVFSPLEAIKGLKWRNKAVGDRFPPSWCALSFSPSQGKEECVHAHVRACVCVCERSGWGMLAMEWGKRCYKVWSAPPRSSVWGTSSGLHRWTYICYTEDYLVMPKDIQTLLNVKKIWLNIGWPWLLKINTLEKITERIPSGRMMEGFYFLF